MGITPAHRVAAVLRNGPEAATAFLAVSRCAGYAPLNPGYTQRDLEFYIADLKADALLIESNDRGPAAAVAEAHGIPVIRMEASPDAPAGVFRLKAERGAGRARAAGDAAALLLHTSGTTSRPKLVPLTERNLRASAANIAAHLALSEADRCLNIMPLFHIHGLMAALLTTISSGGSVVCTDGTYATGFFDWLEEFAPTWYTAVPTMHQAILSRAEQRGETARQARLRFLRSSSAALAPQVLLRMEDMFGAPLLEAYGMTEAAHQMASNPLPPGVRKPGAVGPAAGPEIGVMDETGALLPAGATGEVVIRGENVTAGYEGNPEANRACFSDGWFRTGDQGYLDGDGYLHLTGRLKELINRGGEKISPREIDELMLGHRAVRQALSFAIPHAQLGEEVGVAVELRTGESASEAELRRFATERLPAFKVPKLVRILGEIPKGPTGKLQRIGLAEKLGIGQLDATVTSAGHVEPRDEAERLVAAVWREVLRVEQVGACDTFESLGGDSLLAVRAIVQVNRTIGHELPFLRFLEERTVEAMAAEVRGCAEPGAAPEIVPIRLEGGGRPIFCVPGHDGVLLGIRRLSGLLNGPPVWAYQLRAAERAAEVRELGESMAACVERIQPEGPLRLLGVCFGGLVAYEAACALEARGRAVELLAMVDTLNPAWAGPAGRVAAAGAFMRMCALRAAAHRRALAAMNWRARRSYLASRVAAYFEALAQSGNAYRGAQSAYAPQRAFTGRALLIEVTGRRLAAPMLGWSGWLNGETGFGRVGFDAAGSLSERIAPRVAGLLTEALERVAAHPAPRSAAAGGLG